MKKLSLLLGMVFVLINFSGCAQSNSQATTIADTRISLEKAPLTEKIHDLMPYKKSRETIVYIDEFSPYLQNIVTTKLLSDGKVIEYENIGYNNIETFHGIPKNELVQDNRIFLVGGERYSFYYQYNNSLKEKLIIKKNNELILERMPCNTSANFWLDATLPESNYYLNGEPILTFSEKSDHMKGGCAWNTFYQGKTLNEIFSVDQSRFPFIYKDALGFVATLNNQDYIVFNNKLISSPFTRINTDSCCWPSHFYRLYDTGLLLFKATNDQKQYLVEIDLNKYL